MKVEGAHTTAVREAEAACMQHTLLICNRHMGKPFGPWKVKPLRRKEGLTNLSCRPLEQLSRPVPAEALRNTYVPHTVINRKHAPHWSPDGHPTTDHQPEGSHPLPLPTLRG